MADKVSKIRFLAFSETSSSTAFSAHAAAAREETGHSSLFGACEIIQVIGKGQHDILSEDRGAGFGYLVEGYGFTDGGILFQQVEDA